MKIAVLSDIHGNHYALEQVLIDAKKLNVEKILILGDIVGYYYYPDRVLSLLNNWDYDLIRGNHEILLERVLNGDIKISTLTKKYGLGHKLALDNLTKKQLEYLINSPDKKELIFDGVKVFICHGSNWDPNYYLYPNTDKEILNRTGEVKCDFIFVGHSHYAFMHKNKNNTLINVGSVGQSRKKGGIANWVILDSINKSFEIMETKYNTTNLISEAEKLDPENDYLIQVLKRNSNEK
tara:strand:- start:958 stop:1668 length:711 start_codon:yes stop_codon:yes gene_type:complete